MSGCNRCFHGRRDVRLNKAAVTLASLLVWVIIPLWFIIPRKIAEVHSNRVMSHPANVTFCCVWRILYMPLMRTRTGNEEPSWMTKVSRTKVSQLLPLPSRSPAAPQFELYHSANGPVVNTISAGHPASPVFYGYTLGPLVLPLGVSAALILLVRSINLLSSRNDAGSKGGFRHINWAPTHFLGLTSQRILTCLFHHAAHRRRECHTLRFILRLLPPWNAPIMIMMPHRRAHLLVPPRSPLQLPTSTTE